MKKKLRLDPRDPTRSRIRIDHKIAGAWERLYVEGVTVNDAIDLVAADRKLTVNRVTTGLLRLGVLRLAKATP